MTQLASPGAGALASHGKRCCCIVIAAAVQAFNPLAPASAPQDEGAAGVPKYWRPPRAFSPGQALLLPS